MTTPPLELAARLGALAQTLDAFENMSTDCEDLRAAADYIRKREGEKRDAR